MTVPPFSTWKTTDNLITDNLIINITEREVNVKENVTYNMFEIEMRSPKREWRSGFQKEAVSGSEAEGMILEILHKKKSGKL
ncbi:hypothetical protein B5E62_13645 [Lachnoclostridium sp. An118]|nr:hypothetical protein B5E62_13645 [Lachnoclostridium sp. An118]